ncbi:MAG: hypothetical protein P9L99_03515 [Candidatus Lernaella stagnicola]|nr:hypothetical protein [Candidatus Lernaella stagnicola]
MSVADKLRELAEKVPGVAEFLEREDLREQDKLVRDYAADQMTKIKDGITGIKKVLLEKMQLSLLDDFDRLGQIIGRLRESHRFAAYGYAGAFDRKKINEPELQDMLDKDLEILDTVEQLVGDCGDLCASVTDEDGAKTALASLRVEIKKLEALIESRRAIAGRTGL